MLKKYSLPDLPYDDDALEPNYSQEQLQTHYQKHHQAYVDNANKLFDVLDNARSLDEKFDPVSVARQLSFNIGGQVLHSLFWENLTPNNQNSKEPQGVLAKKVTENFGSLALFKERFIEVAKKIEGSGWVALVYDPKSDRLLIDQIEKHNVNLMPGTKILLVIDMWEHAYYIDYKNAKDEYLEKIFEIINWDEATKRLENLA